MRLFTKTLILIVILFAVIAAAISILSARNLHNALTTEYESKAQAIAQGIADSSTEILLNRNLATMQAIIDQFIEIRGVAYVFVSDVNGEIVAHTFVPAVPEEMKGLVAPYQRRGVISGLETSRVEVEGFGSFIHVAAPILAGVAGFVHVGMDLGYIEAQIWSVVIKQQLLMLAIFLIVVGIAYIAVNRIVQPITRLADYTQTLAAHDFAAGLDIPKEIHRIEEKNTGEIGELAASFIAMETILQQYLKDLEETTAAKQRIESELNIAHEIQMSMIPKTFPPFPERREFDLYAKLISAREVGGDFYDFYFIDERHLCFAIGDVSGKGVPASLFMALTKTLFRATGGKLNPTAREILTHLNDEISRDNASCMFVTLYCGVLDTQTGEVEYTNAGHNPPYLVVSGNVSMLEKTGDIALGVMEGVRYSAGRCRLQTGDVMVLYTDGITEAMNAQNDFYTDKRLGEQLSASQGESSRGVIRRILEDVRAFAGDTPQSDDMTMLVLRYRGSQAEHVPTLAVRLKNQNAELQRFNKLMTDFGEEHGVPEETRFRVRLALDEALVNVVRYAYDDEEDHDIRVVATWDGEWLVIEVQDDGKPFNPLETSQPDIGESLEERKVGGLGIHLVRNMMDELSYRRELDSNILTLKTTPRPDA
jgi:sigma-B regulation protein RsbU (phosphoserine phosphatase)